MIKVSCTTYHNTFTNIKTKDILLVYLNIPNHLIETELINDICQYFIHDFVTILFPND